MNDVLTFRDQDCGIPLALTVLCMSTRPFPPPWEWIVGDLGLVQHSQAEAPLQDLGCCLHQGVGEREEGVHPEPNLVLQEAIQLV